MQVSKNGCPSLDGTARGMSRPEFLVVPVGIITTDFTDL